MRDALKNMVVDVVAQFVCQHRLNFLVLKLLEQRVRQDYPPRIAESHQGGVGLFALFTEFPFKHALHASARAPREFQQALRQGRILQRLDLEKNGKMRTGARLASRTKNPMKAMAHRIHQRSGQRRITA